MNKDVKAFATTFAIGILAAYAFAAYSVRYGPVKGIANPNTNVKVA